MKLLRLIAQMKPGSVDVNGRGQPVWKDEKQGEFVMMATRTDRITGQEVGDIR